MKKILFVAFSILLVVGCKKSDPGTNYPPPTPPKLRVPELITKDVSSLNRYAVTIGAKIVDSGSSKINEQGFVIDTIPMPDKNRNLYKLSLTLDSIATFTLTVKGLPTNTKYYLRAYGVNNSGVGYGNQIEFNSFHEKIFIGNVKLSSQQEVIDFGVNGYSRITGELAIDGPVTDLTPLMGLAVIEAGFIASNTQLVNFNGLDSLEYTGYVFPNHFQVRNNQNLINFSGLSKLKISRGSFSVISNNSLLSMDGLDSYVAASSGDLEIRDCSKIQNVNGLKNLVFVGGDVYLVNNPSLADIKGFGNLATVGYRLNILNNTSLQNLNGLEKIENLPWGIELTGNTSLIDLKGLRNLNNVQSPDYKNGAIIINGNSALRDLSVFSKITKADYVQIQNNTLLPDLNGFNNLESVTFTLKIENNSRLLNLTGLEKLNSVSSLEILSNESLINLKGIDSIKVIANNAYSITIFSNKNLQTLVGLEHLAVATGSIQISGNSSLRDFCPLKPLLIGGYNGFYLAENNANNPALNDIIANCP